MNDVGILLLGIGLLLAVAGLCFLSWRQPPWLGVVPERSARLLGRVFRRGSHDPPALEPPDAGALPPEQRLYHPGPRPGSPPTGPPRPDLSRNGSAPVGPLLTAGPRRAATTRRQAVRTAGDGVAPRVHRFVVADPAAGTMRSREIEPRLPARVVAGCGWHDSFFGGWCGIGSGARATVRLTVRAAALRGATHANNGTEGQDAIGAAWDERRQALYLAVADGLGSLRRSGPVAAQAINAALKLCTTRPDNLTFGDSGPRLYGAIADGLRRTFDNPDELLDGACTLLVAEVAPRFDGAHVTVHGVGDSEAWLLFDGVWKALHHERRAHDNATRELPTHVAPETVLYEVPPGSVLLLGSDGFAGALDTSVSPLARGLAEYWRRAPSWLDFVNHVGFVDDYWSDDRAAVAVWIGDGGADA
jgi:hypothetical protein